MEDLPMFDEYGDPDFDNMGNENICRVQSICKWLERRLEDFGSARGVNFNNDHVAIETSYWDGCHCHGNTAYQSCDIPNEYFFSNKSAADFIKDLEKKHKEEEAALLKKEADEKAASQSAWEKQQYETLKKRFGE